MGNCAVNPAPLVQVGDYEFNPNDIIGAGHHGIMFQGSPRKDKLFEIAVKVINHSFSTRNYNQIQELLKKLCSVHHENIAHYIDYHYNSKEKKLCLIIEFCAHGSLQDLLNSTPTSNHYADVRKNIQYCHQIIAGLSALHQKGVTHGSLRPHNILIHYDVLKISDFGLTELEKLSVEGAKKKYSIFKAPELFKGAEVITEKCDIWSLGVIMYQLVYRIRPLEVQAGEYKLFDLHTGKCPELDDLIAKCLKINPEERISSEELRRHPFISFNPTAIKLVPTNPTHIDLSHEY